VRPKSCALETGFSHPYSSVSFATNTIKHLVNRSNGAFYEDIILAFDSLEEHSLILSAMVEMPCQRWSPGIDDEDETRLRSVLPNCFLAREMVRHGELREGELQKIDARPFLIPE
jgi:hypothetical protein